MVYSFLQGKTLLSSGVRKNGGDHWRKPISSSSLDEALTLNRHLQFSVRLRVLLPFSVHTRICPPSCLNTPICSSSKTLVYRCVSSAARQDVHDLGYLVLLWDAVVWIILYTPGIQQCPRVPLRVKQRGTRWGFTVKMTEGSSGGRDLKYVGKWCVQKDKHSKSWLLALPTLQHLAWNLCLLLWRREDSAAWHVKLSVCESVK